MFIKDKCDFCGECFERCPESGFSPKEAKTEIEKLVKGVEGAGILSKCSSCFACNLYCKQKVNPYDLILERWNERYHKEGAPPQFHMVCPTNEPNLWSSFHAIAPAPARSALDEWLEQQPQEEVLLIGSFNYLIPEVFHGSRLLGGIPALALPQHWECGAYLYQMGYLDEVGRVGKMVREDLDSWGVKKVINTMDAVHHLFTEVQPGEMGVEFSQEFVNFYDWVLERFDSGELAVMKPLDVTVTVQDNCYSKASGGLGMERARRLLQLTGCSMVEMEHSREDALCCGFGLGASWTSSRRIPFDILGGAVRRVKEAEESGADALVTYCGGCMWLLLAASALRGSRVRVMHIVELIREAMGENVSFDPDTRAWDILSVVSYQALREMPRGKFHIDSIRAEAGENAWSAYPKGTLRSMHRIFSSRAGKAAIKAGFKGLSAIT